MKVLVTGGTGYLGNAVINELKKQGYEVTAQGRDPKKCCELEKQGFNVIRMTVEEMTPEICKDFDVVVNCLGEVKKLAAVDYYRPVNVHAVKILADGCEKYDKKLVHVSSTSVYATGNDLRNASENDALPATAVNGYAQSKREAEELIVDAQKRGLRAIQVRPNFVVGEEELHVLGTILRMLLTSGVPLFNEGKALVDLTYKGDFSRAIELCVRTDAGLGQIFNITSGDPQPLKDLLTKLTELLQIPLNITNVPLSFDTIRIVLRVIDWVCLTMQRVGYGVDPDVTEYVASLLAKDHTYDISKSRSVLGYRPIISAFKTIELFAMNLPAEFNAQVEQAHIAAEAAATQRSMRTSP